MAAKKSTTEKPSGNGIGIEKNGNAISLIFPEDIASAIWNDWKSGTVNVCVGSSDNIVGSGAYNKIGNRAAFYFQKAERGNA